MVVVVWCALLTKLYTSAPNPAQEKLNFRRPEITTSHVWLQITSNQPDFGEKWDEKG